MYFSPLLSFHICKKRPSSISDDSLLDCWNYLVVNGTTSFYSLILPLFLFLVKFGPLRVGVPRSHTACMVWLQFGCTKHYIRGSITTHAYLIEYSLFFMGTFMIPYFYFFCKLCIHTSHLFIQKATKLNLLLFSTFLYNALLIHSVHSIIHFMIVSTST